MKADAALRKPPVPNHELVIISETFSIDTFSIEYELASSTNDDSEEKPMRKRDRAHRWFATRMAAARAFCSGVLGGCLGHDTDGSGTA